jgi:hypothetical protein
MNRLLAAAVVLAITLPVLASPPLFKSYEAARTGLLRTSLKDTQTAAKALAAEASKAKKADIAKLATAVATSPDMAKARVAFAALSDEMIKLRAETKGARPSVYHCPMVNKSWLQPKGDVGNPYDAAMAMCGVMKEE